MKKNTQSKISFKEDFRRRQEATHEKQIIKQIRKAIAKTPASSDVVIMRVAFNWELSWCLSHGWEVITSVAPQFEGTAGLTYHTLRRDRAWAQYEVDLYNYQQSMVA